MKFKEIKDKTAFADCDAPLQGRLRGLTMPNGIDFQRLLSGRCEAERLPKDFSPERIVPDFAFNVLNPLGLLYRPVVDEDYLARGGAKPLWPEGKPFAVCLTHDVDQARCALLSFDNLFLICRAKSCRKKYQERRNYRHGKLFPSKT